MIADAVVFGCFALRSLTLADKPFQGYWRQDLESLLVAAHDYQGLAKIGQLGRG